jgi:hypothetical protein
MLANLGMRSHTIGIMKTLSGTVGFVALAVIAILPSCCRKPVSEEVVNDKKFFLKFGKTSDDFADVTDKGAFIEALRRFGNDNIKVKFLDHPGGTEEDWPPLPHSAETRIKTDRVTTPEVAQNAPIGESAAYDPNATYHVKSNNAADIENLLKTFKATPTPTPSL